MPPDVLGACIARLSATVVFDYNFNKKGMSSLYSFKLAFKDSSLSKLAKPFH